MPKKSLLTNIKTIHKLSALLIVLIIAIIGTHLLTGSHAAAPYTSTTATNGALTNGAEEVSNCSGAITTSCIEFGSGGGSTIPMDGNVALGLSTAGTPFSPTSFWNTPIPANVPLNPNSAVYVNEILNQLCYATFSTTAPNTTITPCTKSNISALNTSSWSAPLYVVPANQPLVSVVRTSGLTSSTAFNNAVAGGVPVPSDAHGAGETIVPETDTDKEIQIYQPSTDKYWDFWQFQKNSSGAWEASWGGVINSVSTSDGIFPSNTGATATSLPLLGNVVRIDEMQRGQVDHVMGLNLEYNFYATTTGTPPNTTTTFPANVTDPGNLAYSWPATRNDGRSTSTLAIPEGQRFILNPSLNLTQYAQQHPLTPYAMAIAVAAQKYGFVVDDSAGSVNVRVGDPTTYTNTPSPNLPNPYTSGPGVGGVGNEGLFEGVSQGQIMANFPWSQLQALPFNYGDPN